MALLLLTVTTAWAATVDDLVAVGPGYTFIADNITSNGTVKLTANTLYDNGRIFAPTANSVATNKGNSTIAGESHLNSLRLKNTQDQLVFKVSEPCIVKFYTESKSERGIQAGSEAGGTQYGSQTGGTNAFECSIPVAGLVYLSSFGNDFYFAGFEVIATEKTVYFDNTATQWGQVNIWAWNDTENFTGGEWPGVEMEATDTPNLYKWSTTAGTPAKVIFSNNGSAETASFDFKDGSTYTKDGRVVVLNDYTVTFKTDGGWSKAYAYTWTGDNKELGEWPGTEMTPANEEGKWTITVQAENTPANIIFHNNAGEQTTDLTFEDGKAYEYMMNDYTATFTTDAGWENVYAHVWNGTGDNAKPIFGDYPGKLLEATDGVYTLNFKAFNAESILFNNGTNETKTPDMTFTNNRAYKWITKTPLYRISENQAKIAAGTTFDVTDNDEVVATITYGVSGGKDFAAASLDNNEDYEAFQYVTMGNGENGTATSGTVYYIEPKYDGTITVGVRLNGGKPFFILEDGEAMAGYNGITVAELAKTSFSFPVKGGSKYSIYCTGSKLGFFGFDYEFPELKFKVAGSMTDWNLVNVRADSYTFNLAAGTYQFKVHDGEAWKGIADMTEVAGGLYWDMDGNVCFKLAEEDNVTVNYKSGELFTVEGNFVAPTVALAGSMNEWSSTANVLVPAEDKKTASVTVALDVDYYQLKMVVDGSWLAKAATYELNRDNSSVEHVDQAIDDGPNIAVNADVAGEYTFTWEYATNTLTVTYPVKLPTVALAGTMNDWSASANVLVPAQDKQTASVTVNLAVDDYDFKMVVDGHWLAKDAEYVLHRNWTSVDNVDQEIAYGPNIVLKADYAGDYTFTWEYATNTLTVTFPTPSGELTLSDETDNSAVLTTWDGCVADVTLNRTLKTGMWNTFAAPFSREIPTGWTVKELTATSYDANENKVTMSFGDASSIEAGKPYLVKVNTNDDLQLDVFSAVTVSKTPQPFTSTYVDFIPTLGKTTIEGVDAKNVLFLAAENKLKNPDEIPTDMKGFRAYFLLKGDAANARVFNLDLGEGETTSISEKLKVDSEQFAPTAIMYDLQGRRVQNAAQKGVYIMNGRKVVKK